MKRVIQRPDDKYAAVQCRGYWQCSDERNFTDGAVLCHRDVMCSQLDILVLFIPRPGDVMAVVPIDDAVLEICTCHKAVISCFKVLRRGKPLPSNPCFQ